MTLFGYGIEPEAQSLYQVTAGRDLVPGDTPGVVLSEPAARLLRAAVGDTVTLLGRLDPQVVTAAVGRRLIVRGMVRWLYDYRGQPSVGTVLPVMQRLARRNAEDRASIILVKAREDGAGPGARRVAAGAISPDRGQQRRRPRRALPRAPRLLPAALLHSGQHEPDRRRAAHRHAAHDHGE